MGRDDSGGKLFAPVATFIEHKDATDQHRDTAGESGGVKFGSRIVTTAAIVAVMTVMGAGVSVGHANAT